MQPDINVLKIGGQSIIDRGREAVLPILDVLYQGERRAQDYSNDGRRNQGSPCLQHWSGPGMPTGVLSKLGDRSVVAECRNAHCPSGQVWRRQDRARRRLRSN